jgi:2,3-bisphosphoglycerate-independent phosphoglycerate mutase
VLEGVRIIARPVKEHRFVVVFSGAENLSDAVTDTDPQQIGVKPLQATAIDKSGQKTARIVNLFNRLAREQLEGFAPANMILMRGFSVIPSIPTMADLFKLRPAAIASYPMYRGLAKLVGMQILPTGPDISDEIQTLQNSFSKHDFFFIHIKGTDSSGEDGNFDRKVQIIEEIDSYMSQIFNLEPDVLVITGDHSTPAMAKGHTWHPVPLMIYSKYWPDKASSFSESACLTGGLGIIPAVSIMPLAMANAFKLSKYGA